MEGVGARLGRSSTQYGPAAAFIGAVRKWRKTWVPLSRPHNSAANRFHLVLFKWALACGNGAAAAQPQEPPHRKFRYVPVSVFEEQKEDTAVKSEEENKANVADPSPSETELSNGNTAVHDLSVEVQASENDQDHDNVNKGGNGTGFNLNLGLKDPDGDNERDLNMGGLLEGISR